MSDPDGGIDRQWYWDRRNKKAYYPIKEGGEAVRFVTAWKPAAVRDAIEGGALVPLSEMKPGYLEGRSAGFEHFDSDRILEEAELAAYTDD